VRDARRALAQAAALVALSVLVGAAVHFPLVERFARGEFRETFFQSSEYPGIRLIALAEAEDLWAGGTAVVLDARAEGFFKQGHVPGSRNLPASASGFDVPAAILEVPKDRTFVVYCEGGDCQSSLALAKHLHEAGFRDVRVFTGGWDEWRAAGLPEEKAEKQGGEGERVGRE
jgi:rhodanese-related sulfurtransferase